METAFSHPHRSSEEAVELYINREIAPTLVRGLAELCRKQPDNPTVTLL